MNRFKANQKLLFKVKTVFNLEPLEKYEILFSFLDTSSLEILEILYPSTGRPPIAYEALLKALVYKNIKNISYLSDLVRELQDNPDLALVFGFYPLRLPCVENFSAFLGDTENSIFQEVRDSLVSKLIKLKEIKGTHLTFDSSNIPVKVKENKLKTFIKDRFDKTNKPIGVSAAKAERPNTTNNTIISKVILYFFIIKICFKNKIKICNTHVQTKTKFSTS